MVKLKSIKSRIQKVEGSRLASVDSSSWRAGKTSSQRGYNYKWQKARERYLQLHPLCCYCERAGRIAAASVVDHRVPHRGDQALFWDEGNWQPLCKPCHDSVKQAEEAAGLT